MAPNQDVRHQLLLTGLSSDSWGLQLELVVGLADLR